jgi:hypothetical protein
MKSIKRWLRRSATIAVPLGVSLALGVAANATTITVTSTSYTHQTATSQIVSTTETGVTVNEDGKIEAGWESTNVPKMGHKKVLKRCAQVQDNQDLRRLLNHPTKKFKRYALICFLHGYKGMKERFQTATGFVNVKMPPVWGAFRVGHYDSDSGDIRAQGTWFTVKQLKTTKVKRQLLKLGHNLTQINLAIKHGGGWFIFCDNLLVKVANTTINQLDIQMKLRRQYRVDQLIGSHGTAHAEGQCPDGNGKGSATGVLDGYVHNFVLIWAKDSVELTTATDKLTVTSDLVNKAIVQADAELTMWAQASITLDCAVTPPPSYQAPSAVATARGCVEPGQQDGIVDILGTNPNDVAVTSSSVVFDGRPAQPTGPIGANGSVTINFGFVAPGTYTGTFTLGAPVNKTVTFQVTMASCPEQPNHWVNVGCTSPEEITVGGSVLVDCVVTADSGQITLSVVNDDTNSRVSGVNCYSNGGSQTCPSGGTFEFRLTGEHEGTTSVTVKAMANGVTSEPVHIGPMPVDPADGGF